MAYPTQEHHHLMGPFRTWWNGASPAQAAWARRWNIPPMAVQHAGGHTEVAGAAQDRVPSLNVWTGWSTGMRV